MKYIDIEIEGFESAADPISFSFGDKKMLLFTGANGAGKSLIAMWAPLFALYGKIRQKTLHQAINTSKGAGTVTLTFEMGASLYRVSRTISRTSPQQVTFDSFNREEGIWEAVSTRRSVAEVNQDIINVVGMDYKQAIATFVAPQGSYDAFTSATPANRRKLAQQIFQLEGFENLRAAADLRVKSLAVEEASLKSQIEQNRRLRNLLGEHEPTEFDDMDDFELQDELDRLQEEDEELQKREWELASKGARAHELLEAAKEAIRAFERSKAESVRSASEGLRYAKAALRGAEIQRLNQELENLGVAQQRLKEIDPEISQTEEKRLKAQSLLRSLESEQENLKNLGESLAGQIASHQTALNALLKQESLLQENHGSKCNTCNQDLTPEMAESLFRINRKSQEDEKQEIQELEARLVELRNGYSEKTQRINSGRGYISAQESLLSNLRMEKNNLAHSIQREPSLQQALAEAQRLHNEALAQIEVNEKLLAEAENLQIPGSLIADRDDALEYVKQVEAGSSAEDFDYSGRTRISLIEREISRRATVLDKETRFDIEHDRLVENHESISEDLSHHKILLAEFSPTGLPALIMAGFVQELEDEINVHLERFSNGKYSINLETQREKRDGSVEERIDVTINAPDGTRDYDSFSGGERFRIDLAIHIALCEISARRKGLDAIKTIVIDEGFGALDGEGIRQAVSTLKEVSEEMNVIAISHIDAVKEAFTHIVEVGNEGGSTYIRSAS